MEKVFKLGGFKQSDQSDNGKLITVNDLRDTVDCGRKGLVDFNAGKAQLVSFDWSNDWCY